MTIAAQSKEKSLLQEYDELLRFKLNRTWQTLLTSNPTDVRLQEYDEKIYESKKAYKTYREVMKNITKLLEKRKEEEGIYKNATDARDKILEKIKNETLNSTANATGSNTTVS